VASSPQANPASPEIGLCSVSAKSPCKQEVTGSIPVGSTGNRDLDRTIMGRDETVGQALLRESVLLRALPIKAFDAREQSTPGVDSKGLVTVRQNRYSVLVALAGRKVLVKIGAREIEILQKRRLLTRHERLQGRFGVAAQLTPEVRSP
jgi:hypothetical protein